VGTSCTLALVAEDRRRRINNALRVIENGAKVKSARNYHAGGAALALALEEEVLVDSTAQLGASSTESTITSTQQLRLEQLKGISKKETGTPTLVMPQELPHVDPPIVSRHTEQATGPLLAKPNPFVKPPSVPTIPRSRTSVEALFPDLKPHVLNDLRRHPIEHIIKVIHEASARRFDDSKLSYAVLCTLQAYKWKKGKRPQNLDQKWVHATALLCRNCQKRGHLDEATAVLKEVVAAGEIEEVDYFVHEPMALIESLLSQAEQEWDQLESRREYLLNAMRIFRPRLATSSDGSQTGVYHVGKRLVAALVSTFEVVRADRVFRRCWKYAGTHKSSFTNWFINQAQGAGEFKIAIRVFISFYGISATDKAMNMYMGNTIVDCVESSQGFRAADVLRVLLTACNGVCDPKHHWIIRLFEADWASHRDYGQTEALFNELFEGLDTTNQDFPWPGVYQVMIQLALEVGQSGKVDFYLQKRREFGPDINKDIQLLGVFARHYAKLGNWEKVRRTFEKMEVDTPATKAHGNVFIPVLKAYAAEHSMRETEDFLRQYTEDLKVPLCRYSVTLMAKHYTKIRDFDAVANWLEFCSKSNFRIDSAFTNAIVATCRQAKTPFRDLRTLFRKISALNPEFVDSHTERLMTTSALGASKFGGNTARGRVLSLRLNRQFLPRKAKLAFGHENDVVLAMKEAMTIGNYVRAVRYYKSAVRMGIPMSPVSGALRLAMQATMVNEHDSRADKEYHLLRFAQENGQSIVPVMNHIIAAQLKKVDTGGDAATIYETLVSTLEFFEGKCIVLADVTYNRAADICLKIGFPETAIKFAHRAAEARNHSKPCYNIHNFRIILTAYLEAVNINGMSKAISDALESDYREDSSFLETLKHARRKVTQTWVGKVPCEQWQRALDMIQDGIQNVVGQRKELEAKRRRLQEVGLRIMEQAALEAGCPPLDFDTIPWLGGKPTHDIAIELELDNEFLDEDHMEEIAGDQQLGR